MPTVRKKPRRTEVVTSPGGNTREEDDAADTNTNVKVMVQLVDENGVPAGAQVLVPVGTTSAQLEELLASLRAQPTGAGDDDDEGEGRVPHAFFVGEEQITSNVKDVVYAAQKKQWLETRLAQGRRVKPGDADDLPFEVPEEAVVRITYRPQAVFRVRAVSRCSATLDGHEDAVLIVAFSPDGRMLATGGGDKEIKMWDVLTSTPVDELKGHRHWVQVLSWSPDGKHLASGSRDGGLLLWSHDGDYGGWSQTALRGHTNYLSHVSWEPLHRNANCDRFVSASKDMSLKVWKVGVGLLFNLAAHTACVSCVKWGGDGCIYSSSQDKNIIVWNAENGAAVSTLRGHGHWVNFIALNTDLVLRTGSFDHEERTFDTPAAACEYAATRYRAVIARCGSERIVSCSDDNTMFLWCPSQSEKPIARLTGHQGVVFQCSFSPDGMTLASCSADKSIRLWHGVTGKFIATLRGHVAAVYHVSWSLDSRLLVSGSRDSTLKLWSVASKKLVEDLPGHSDEIFSTDWSPDGQRVATGSKDKKVKIWVH